MKWYDWFFDVLKNKYATFEGRARRKEYWNFQLVAYVIGIGLLFIDVLTGTFNSDVSMGLLSGIYGVAIIIPSIAVSIRRLHDTNHSGLWFLLFFIPFVGALILIILYVRDSTPEQNKYGPNPKTISA